MKRVVLKATVAVAKLIWHTWEQSFGMATVIALLHKQGLRGKFIEAASIAIASKQGSVIPQMTFKCLWGGGGDVEECYLTEYCVTRCFVSLYHC